MLEEYPLFLPCFPQLLTLPTEGTSSSQQVKANGMQTVRDSLRPRGVSEKASALTLNSWRWTTQQQYHAYLKKWYNCCTERCLNPCSVPVKALDFLTKLFEQGLGYSALNTARSALSHPSLSTSWKGFFNRSPLFHDTQLQGIRFLLLNFLKTQLISSWETESQNVNS